MARANRFYTPGYVWHITHRCHKREFLLKFSRDRRRWLDWLFQAKQRFGLVILNYVVTHNHIHLLVEDSGEAVIPRSMQLVSGRVAQEYNCRKKRKGAFWDDRYHATAVDTGEYLAQCLVYIDLNMVRAGVVTHPRDWRDGGYHELQNRKQRYGLIDHQRLTKLLELNNYDAVKRAHIAWIDDRIQSDQLKRDAKWTESLAIGGESFAENYLNALGIKANARKLEPLDDCYRVKESRGPYDVVLDGK